MTLTETTPETFQKRKEHISAHSLTLLYGETGGGKTSLLTRLGAGQGTASQYSSAALWYADLLALQNMKDLYLEGKVRRRIERKEKVKFLALDALENAPSSENYQIKLTELLTGRAHRAETITVLAVKAHTAEDAMRYLPPSVCDLINASGGLIHIQKEEGGV